MQLLQRLSAGSPDQPVAGQTEHPDLKLTPDSNQIHFELMQYFSDFANRTIAGQLRKRRQQIKQIAHIIMQNSFHGTL